MARLRLEHVHLVVGRQKSFEKRIQPGADSASVGNGSGLGSGPNSEVHVSTSLCH